MLMTRKIKNNNHYVGRQSFKGSFKQQAISNVIMVFVANSSAI